MTPTIDLLLNNRFIHAFSTQPIAPDARDAIIAAAQSASSSNFLQCSSIIRITDPALRQTLAHDCGDQHHVAAAEFWVFCADFHRHLDIFLQAQTGMAEQLLLGCVDTALMEQNALVAAESLGLSGVFIGDIRNHIADITALLALPPQVLPLFDLCLGYPAATPHLKPRLPASLQKELRPFILDYLHQQDWAIR